VTDEPMPPPTCSKCDGPLGEHRVQMRFLADSSDPDGTHDVVSTQLYHPECAAFRDVDSGDS